MSGRKANLACSFPGLGIYPCQEEELLSRSSDRRLMRREGKRELVHDLAAIPASLVATQAHLPGLGAVETLVKNHGFQIQMDAHVFAAPAVLDASPYHLRGSTVTNGDLLDSVVLHLYFVSFTLCWGSSNCRRTALAFPRPLELQT